MADLNKEALDIWGSLKPMIDEEIASRTQGMVQRRKAKVTTAPSLVTNTIGVTEAFGQEIFLPFVTNIASAKVGDFVWIEWMYGASNAFVSCFAEVDEKDFTVAGVLDVTPRRCYATLSSAGWYRAITYNGESGADAIGDFGRIFDISITRLYNDGNNEVHKISLLNPYNVYTFANESSRSNGFFVDGIRTVYNSDSKQLHIDIHYNTTRSNNVTVDFVMHSQPTTYGRCVAAGLANVTTLPANDAVQTTYDFHANGDYTNMDLSVDGTLDVVSRRCYATLSSAGWYRVMDVAVANANASKFSVATIVDINIGTVYWNNSNGTHKISLHGVFNNVAFLGEESKSNNMLISKVRYTYDSSGNGHIDIYYTGTSQNEVWCTFAVHMPYSYQHWFVTNNFTAVAVSPSGETVVTEYTFVANTGGKITFTPSNCSVYRTCWYARIGNVCYLHIDISGLTANTNTYIFTLPVGFRPSDYMALRGSGQESWGATARATVTNTGDINVYSSDRYALIDGSFICVT